MNYSDLEQLINKSNIISIDTNTLDDLYCKYQESDVICLNIMCQLMGVFYEVEKNCNKDLIAHAAFLVSYYVFMALTPPKSENIALFFAEKAYGNQACNKYYNWLEQVKKGN